MPLTLGRRGVEKNVFVSIDKRTWKKRRCEDSRKGCPYDVKVMFTGIFTFTAVVTGLAPVRAFLYNLYYNAGMTVKFLSNVSCADWVQRYAALPLSERFRKICIRNREWR